MKKRILSLFVVAALAFTSVSATFTAAAADPLTIAVEGEVLSIDGNNFATEEYYSGGHAYNGASAEAYSVTYEVEVPDAGLYAFSFDAAKWPTSADEMGWLSQYQIKIGEETYTSFGDWNGSSLGYAADYIYRYSHELYLDAGKTEITFTPTTAASDSYKLILDCFKLAYLGEGVSEINILGGAYTEIAGTPDVWEGLPIFRNSGGSPVEVTYEFAVPKAGDYTISYNGVKPGTGWIHDIAMVLDETTTYEFTGSNTTAVEIEGMNTDGRCHAVTYNQPIHLEQGPHTVVITNVDKTVDAPQFTLESMTFAYVEEEVVDTSAIIIAGESYSSSSRTGGEANHDYPSVDGEYAALYLFEQNENLPLYLTYQFTVPADGAYNFTFDMDFTADREWLPAKEYTIVDGAVTSEELLAEDTNTYKLLRPTSEGGVLTRDESYGSVQYAPTDIARGVEPGVNLTAGEKTLVIRITEDLKPNNVGQTQSVIVLDQISISRQADLSGFAIVGDIDKVNKGANLALRAVDTAGADVAGVEWTSSNENIATVVDGVVKGINPGTVVITATVGEYTAEKTIYVCEDIVVASATIDGNFVKVKYARYTNTPFKFVVARYEVKDGVQTALREVKTITPSIVPYLYQEPAVELDSTEGKIVVYTWDAIGTMVPLYDSIVAE